MVIKIKRSKNPYLILSFLIAAWICVAQIMGNTLLILACLVCFLLMTAVAAWHGVASPILMFFLPWAPLLKLAPGTTSFYTLALIAVCLVGFFRRRFAVNIYCVLFAIVLCAFSLIAKALEGDGLSTSYILFIYFLFLFPPIMSEIRDKVDFRTLTMYFSLGIIAAALSAQQLRVFPRIARYINVYSWNVVTRLSGYYEDPNFYSAHISAALSGVLLMFLREAKGRQRGYLLLLAVVLLYCGFLSASKAFFVTLACLFVSWLWKFFSMRGGVTRKLLMLAGIAVAFAVILASGIFAEQWEVIVFRFGQSNTLSGLTTGRTELWISYCKALLENAKLLILGKGFSNDLVNGAASHNTVIQILYQFGVLGSMILLAWIYCFIRGTLRYHKVNVQTADTIVLLIGVFLPWMALDLLFFDEFFLMPLYVVAGLVYIGKIKTGESAADRVTSG